MIKLSENEKSKKKTGRGSGLPHGKDMEIARERKVQRLEIIRKIIEERGWLKVTELVEILRNEYKYADGSPITSSRYTIYNDLDELGKQMDIPARERANLLARYKRKINEIEKMIKRCDNDKDKIALYKLWTQYSKDYSVVVGRMSAEIYGSGVDGQSQKTPINITFTTKEENKNDDDET